MREAPGISLVVRGREWIWGGNRNEGGEKVRETGQGHRMAH